MIDASDGAVSTTGSLLVPGGSVAISSASTVQTMMTTSFVQLRELLGDSSSNAVSLGSSSAGFMMRRVQHDSWDGTATTLRSQAGSGSSANGGDLVLRAGAGGIIIAAQAATAVDASTGVFTTSDPATAGFSPGDTVQVSDSGGGSCTALAGTYTVTAVSSTALTLADMAGADPSTPSHCLVGRDAKKAIVFASDSNGSASNPGYVGVYQSVGGTC